MQINWLVSIWLEIFLDDVSESNIVKNVSKNETYKKKIGDL